jgi:hypothetical protein
MKLGRSRYPLFARELDAHWPNWRRRREQRLPGSMKLNRPLHVQKQLQLQCFGGGNRGAQPEGCATKTERSAAHAKTNSTAPACRRPLQNQKLRQRLAV